MICFNTATINKEYVSTLNNNELIHVRRNSEYFCFESLWWLHNLLESKGLLGIFNYDDEGGQE